MAKTNYSFGKRQRELEREKKKQDKEARKRDRATSGGNIPIATVEELQGGGNIMSIDEVMQSMQGGDEAGQQQQQRTIPSRLFVGGLAWGVSTDKLRETFEAVGRVADAVVMVDRDTGDSRGFGFVTMADRRDATEAIRRLDGADLDGRTLVVRQATERGR
jgi:RNA recognition motif-containing protein